MEFDSATLGKIDACSNNWAAESLAAAKALNLVISDVYKAFFLFLLLSTLTVWTFRNEVEREKLNRNHLDPLI